MRIKQFTKFVGLYVAVAVFVTSLLLPLEALIPQSTSAAGAYTPPTSGKWVNGGEIDSTSLDNHQNFKVVEVINNNAMILAATECRTGNLGNKTLDGLWVGPNPQDQTITTDYTTARSAVYISWLRTCQPTDKGVTITDKTVKLGNSYNDATSAIAGSAYWSKVDPLNPVGVLHATFTLGSFTKTDETFTQSSINGNSMILTGTKAGAGCKQSYVDTMVVGTSGKSKNYWQDTTATITTYVPGHDELSSTTCVPVIGLISLIDQSTGKPASYIDAGGQAPTKSTDNGDGGCPFDPNGLNFLLCGVWGLLRSTTQTIADNMAATLYVNTSAAKNGGGVFGPTFKAAFDSFRNIALTVIILVGLVMVISQAAGLEIFSAYSIKKRMVPLVLAVIGISLAWPIMQIVVPFFNDLGTWTQSIIQDAIAPIQGAQAGAGLGLLGILFSVVGVNAFIGLGAAGMLALALTVLVALFVAFVTLILRQIIIVLCIMLAPLAIALSVFPGTEGMFKFWRTTFIGMLIMFPAIMGLLSAGDAVSRVAQAEAQQPGGGYVTNGWVFLTIAVVAKYLPYLMLPAVIGATNRTMGGIQNTLRGFANSRLKGTYDRLGKVQQANKDAKFQERMAGTRRVAGEGMPGIGRGIGGAYRRFFTPGGFSLGGGAKVQKNMQMTAQKLAEDDKGFLGLNNTDDADALNTMIANGGNRFQVLSRFGLQGLSRAEATYGQVGRKTTRLAATKALMNSTSMLPDVAFDPANPGAFRDTSSANMESVYRTVASLEADGVINRNDSIGLIKSAKLPTLSNVSGGAVNAGLDAARGIGGTWNNNTYERIMGDAATRIEAPQLVHAPPASIRAIGAKIARDLTGIGGGAPLTAEQRAAYTAHIAKVYSELSQASIGNAQVLRDTLAASGGTVWNDIVAAGVVGTPADQYVGGTRIAP